MFYQDNCGKNFLISVVSVNNADYEWFSLVTVEWRQNLNRVYKKISPQKMSPSHSLEAQTVVCVKSPLALDCG